MAGHRPFCWVFAHVAAGAALGAGVGAAFGVAGWLTTPVEGSGAAMRVFAVVVVVAWAALLGGLVGGVLGAVPGTAAAVAGAVDPRAAPATALVVTGLTASPAFVVASWRGHAVAWLAATGFVAVAAGLSRIAARRLAGTPTD